MRPRVAGRGWGASPEGAARAPRGAEEHVDAFLDEKVVEAAVEHLVHPQVRVRRVAQRALLTLLRPVEDAVATKRVVAAAHERNLHRLDARVANGAHDALLLLAALRRAHVGPLQVGLCGERGGDARVRLDRGCHVGRRPHTLANGGGCRARHAHRARRLVARARLALGNGDRRRHRRGARAGRLWAARAAAILMRCRRGGCARALACRPQRRRSRRGRLLSKGGHVAPAATPRAARQRSSRAARRLDVG
eukprot:4058999-Pleurochrysis_carterae.AAC.1